MITTVYFVRHAHSIYTPDELNRSVSLKGLADSNKITEILEKEAVDYVLSSPYKRAIQTVEGIAERIGKEIIIEEHFKERKLSEKPVKDFIFANRKVWEDPTFSWEGGESNLTAQKRGIEALLKVLEKYSGKKVVIATHGNLMTLVMNHFDKSFGFRFWEELDMPDSYKLIFEKTTLKEVIKLWDR